MLQLRRFDASALDRAQIFHVMRHQCPIRLPASCLPTTSRSRRRSVISMKPGPRPGTTGSTAIAWRRRACSPPSPNWSTTYGEDAVAKFVGGPARARAQRRVLAGAGEAVILLHRHCEERKRRSNPSVRYADMDCFAALAMTGPPYAFSVSRNRTGSPVDGVVTSPCHITRLPRTKVPTGQPVTRTPS